MNEQLTKILKGIESDNLEEKGGDYRFVEEDWKQFKDKLQSLSSEQEKKLNIMVDVYKNRLKDSLEQEKDIKRLNTAYDNLFKLKDSLVKSFEKEREEHEKDIAVNRSEVYEAMNETLNEQEKLIKGLKKGVDADQSTIRGLLNKIKEQEKEIERLKWAYSNAKEELRKRG